MDNCTIFGMFQASIIVIYVKSTINSLNEICCFIIKLFNSDSLALSTRNIIKGTMFKTFTLLPDVMRTIKLTMYSVDNECIDELNILRY